MQVCVFGPFGYIKEIDSFLKNHLSSRFKSARKDLDPTPAFDPTPGEIDRSSVCPLRFYIDHFPPPFLNFSFQFRYFTVSANTRRTLKPLNCFFAGQVALRVSYLNLFRTKTSFCGFTFKLLETEEHLL